MIFANGMVLYEGVPAGGKNQWCFAADTEVQYILQGKTEIHYSLEGTQHTEIKMTKVEEGDIYMIPRGARLKWNVDATMDMMRISIIIPGMGSPMMAPNSVEKIG